MRSDPNEKGLWYSVFTTPDSPYHHWVVQDQHGMEYGRSFSTDEWKAIEDAQEALKEATAEYGPLGEGDVVSYHTAGLWRTVTVLRTPRPNSKTVMVSGFRYKHGGLARPRRVYRAQLRLVNRRQG